MTMRIVIFGGGMQGRVIAQNLIERPERPEVIMADIRAQENLPRDVQGKVADVLDIGSVDKITKDADAAVLAVPSHIAHEALSNLIRCGLRVADVSFTPNPPLDLDISAKRSGSCCVIDTGVAPGLSHILAAAAHQELEGLDSLKIFVGGIPEAPPPVFHHAIYFNPRDLLAEYVRPARARSDGNNIAPQPLEVEFETYNDPDFGTLESFLSDGLRTLLESYPDVANMYERTLRWKGHLQTMKDLYEMGLFKDSRSLNGIADALGERYPAEQHPDLMVMLVEGRRKGGKRKAWRLIDKNSNGQSAMSRTTGFTTAAITMILAKRLFNQPGVHPPEVLGKNASLTAHILDDLAKRGLSITEA
jgi:lysine 6-dehydrogenase